MRVLGAGLRELTDPLVDQVRGSGLWWGVQLRAEVAGAVEAAARDRGLLVNAVKPDVIRLAPALIVDEPTVRAALARLAESLAAVSSGLPNRSRPAETDPAETAFAENGRRHDQALPAR